ncbi:MAG: hypothetical protein KDJ77_13365 [Rhodobiaceae bacterium]|nr:hypothetical protein [Rhodobiaceae bacterium]
MGPTRIRRRRRQDSRRGGADPDLTENQQRVYDHLQLCAIDSPEGFNISSAELASRARVSETSINWLTTKLEEKGLITVRRQRGYPPFYIVPVPEDDDLGDTPQEARSAEGTTGT